MSDGKEWIPNAPENVELAQHFRSMHEALIKTLQWIQELRDEVSALRIEIETWRKNV